MSNEVVQILDGIDRDELDGGWWETSDGVKFGTQKLKEVVTLVFSLDTKISAQVKRIKELEKFDNSYHRLIVLCSGLLSGNNDVEDIRAELKSYITSGMKL